MELTQEMFNNWTQSIEERLKDKEKEKDKNTESKKEENKK